MSQREIRFRAWDKILQCFSRGSMELSYDKDGRFSIFAGDRYIIMQSTGLLDVRGREIFEGDIVVMPGAAQALCVQYQSPSFVMRAKTPSGGWSKAWSEFILSPDQHQIQEIIGNIYENSGLLSPAPAP